MIPDPRISQMVLKEMRAEIAAGSQLLKERLRPLEDSPSPAAGFSDLFAAACESEAAPGDPNLSAPAGSGSRIEAVSTNGHCRFGLEYIFEGYLLHYGQSRLLSPGSPDFNLLAGDYMYARGLDHISRLNDPACIKMFANLVSLCSYVSCEKLPPVLALRAWTATTLCLAAKAAGNDSACFRQVEELKKDMWRGQGAADSLAENLQDTGSAFDDLLAAYSPSGRRFLSPVLSDIYSLYAH